MSVKTFFATAIDNHWSTENLWTSSLPMNFLRMRSTDARWLSQIQHLRGRIFLCFCKFQLGAVPVLTSQQTRTEHVSLEPYHTKSIEYHFYFPVAGRFSHYPVHVAKNEKIVAMVDSVELNVVEKPTKLDIQSWDYISQNGTNEEVIQFIDAHNVKEIQFDRIAWRMREPEMFLSVTSRLERCHTYSDTLWSYSIFHNQPEAIREYLQHSDSFVLQCGGRLSSDLVSIDPVVRGTFEHLEYKPLANARAHSLGCVGRL